MKTKIYAHWESMLILNPNVAMHVCIRQFRKKYDKKT